MPGQHALSCMWDLRSQEWDCSVPIVRPDSPSAFALPSERRSKAEQAQQTRDIRQANEAAVVRNLMETPLGRAFVRLIYPKGPAGQLEPTWSTFDPNAMTMARKSGWQEAASRIWDILGRHAPESRLLMVQEPTDDDRNSN